MSICVTESSQSRRMLDEYMSRGDVAAAQKQAEADLAFDFTQAILAGDPDAMPGWTGTTPDYDAGRKLGMNYGAPGFPRRRVTVGDAMLSALDYTNGPSLNDVVKVLSLTMKCSDPIAALAARQLVERAAAKWASHNAPEVDE